MNNPQDREEIIFEAALQLPPEQRAAYLDKICGNDLELRKRIELLLKSHAEASEDFLQQAHRSIGPNKTMVIPAFVSTEEKLGSMIGRYKLLEKVGEGGFGVVYVAEQREPVKRRVALKIIKLGMDTKQVVARFEAERQALAMMDHPNIAKVFDAGATEKGRPYFVMELVRGIRITDYCDQNNLSTRERLELFAKVCQAIQHAHQKGIIHRDIKPSNILVTLHDGVPVPKVIDFGIAKATQGELTDKTVYTELQQFIGTPAYMSPEQAEMSGLDIDTRSDIYALGVLLYELLTGKTPFDQKDLLSAGLDGMRRMIREQEPVRPSTRVSSLLGEDMTTTAKRHGLEAPKLAHLLRGDLDWIVMKCLEKDRTRRYETANGVAMDLQRHLNNEPVVARPPSTVYRLQKFARRNKLAFAAGAAVATALCLGVIASTWQAVRATRERHIADRERARAQTEAQRADANAGAEARQRQAAERSTLRANQTLSDALANEGDRLDREGNSGKALAHFARALRVDPANRAAAQRIISMLDQHDFPLEMAERPANLKFNPFSVIAYSSDLRWFCEAADTNRTSIAVYDSQDGKMVGKPIPLEDRLNGYVWVHGGGGRFDGGETNKQITIRLSADGSRLAIGLTNRTTFWECASGRKLSETAGQMESFSPDGKTAVVEAEVVAVETGKPLFPLAASALRGPAAFSADSQMVAVVNVSNYVAQVLFTTNGQRAVPDFPSVILGATPSLLFTPDGRRLIDSGSHGAVAVWDLVQQRQCLPMMNHGNSVWGMACSADGRLLATGTRAGRANLWNLLNGEPAREPCQTADTVWQICLAPDCTWLGTRSVGINAINFTHHWLKNRWWDIRAGRSIPIKLVHPDQVYSAIYAPDGSLIRTLCKDGAARIWSAQSGEPVGSPIMHGGGVKVANFSPDSTLLATGASGGDIRLWGAKSGKEIKILGRHETRVSALAFSPDGRYLASGAADGSLKMWEVRSGKVLAEPAIPKRDDQGIMCLTFDRTGQRLLAGYHSGGAEILETPALRRVAGLAQHGGTVFHAVYSPDGKWIATSLGDDSAELWDAQTGAGPKARYPHESGVWDSEFSSDGRLLATASYDHTARVWDTLTGKPITEPLPNAEVIRTVWFSPDDRTVITAGGDGLAMVWDAATGRALSEKFHHDGAANSACFSPDGKHILTAGRDGVVAIYDWVPLDEHPPMWLAELAEAVGGYRLSDAGVAEYVEDSVQILARLRQSLTNAAPSDAVRTWGQWYLADRGTRTISPFAHISVHQMAEQLSQRNDAQSLEAALDLGSRNPVTYRKLAALVDAVQPGTASLYRRLAADLALTHAATRATAGGPVPSASASIAEAGPFEDVDPLAAEDLLKHDGRLVRARGKIVKYAQNSTGNVYYLNFTVNYRDGLSLVFRPTEGASEFTPETIAVLTNKTVVVEGKLINYRGAGEILIDSFNQIKIVEETAASLVTPATNVIASTTGTVAAAGAALEVIDARDGDQFLKRVGQVVKVKGRVVRFGSATSTHIYYLNFSENFRSGLSLVFFGDQNPVEFRPELLKSYVGKDVVVEGKITSYLNRPQLEPKSLNDIKIEETTSPVSTKE